MTFLPVDLQLVDGCVCLCISLYWLEFKQIWICKQELYLASLVLNRKLNLLEFCLLYRFSWPSPSCRCYLMICSRLGWCAMQRSRRALLQRRALKKDICGRNRLYKVSLSLVVLLWGLVFLLNIWIGRSDGYKGSHRQEFLILFSFL